MDPCNETQEKIAAGLALPDAHQRHAAACARCAAVAASYSLLDATLETFAPRVPEGFADGVMALVAAEAAPRAGAKAASGPATIDGPGQRLPRWFERRPVQLVVANAAALCAVFNVAWFVMRVFSADVALGGTP
jgi:hypothetical protein